MKLENQVCTLEQAKRLKELGVKQESSIECFTPASYQAYSPQRLPSDDEFYYDAFTCSELGEMLPQRLKWKKEKDGWESNGNAPLEIAIEENGVYMVRYVLLHTVRRNTEASARAAMLIHLLENKLITVDEVNKKIGE